MGNLYPWPCVWVFAAEMLLTLFWFLCSNVALQKILFVVFYHLSSFVRMSLFNFFNGIDTQFIEISDWKNNT